MGVSSQLLVESGPGTLQNGPVEGPDDIAVQTAKTAQAMTRRPGVSVTFGTIQVRSYPTVISDNPSVMEGAPIGLGWEYKSDASELTVEQYEETKEPSHHGDALVLSPEQRYELLSNAGFSAKEITEASIQAAKARKKRDASYEWSTLPIAKITEFFVDAKISMKSRRNVNSK